jgi:hypothetical protein
MKPKRQVVFKPSTIQTDPLLQGLGMQKMGRWLAEYRCGCTNVQQKKGELLEYCGKHGENRRLVVKLPQETECGLA